MLGIEPNFTSASMLFTCTIFGFISFFPQIIKAIKTKNTDDIAVLSWIIWIAGYVITAIYAFVYTLDKVFFILETVEGSICLFTLLICLKYRSKRR